MHLLSQHLHSPEETPTTVVFKEYTVKGLSFMVQTVICVYTYGSQRYKSFYGTDWWKGGREGKETLMLQRLDLAVHIPVSLFLSSYSHLEVDAHLGGGGGM